jgi:hypothetical protein
VTTFLILIIIVLAIIAGYYYYQTWFERGKGHVMAQSSRENMLLAKYALIAFIVEGGGKLDVDVDVLMWSIILADNAEQRASATKALYFLFKVPEGTQDNFSNDPEYTIVHDKIMEYYEPMLAARKQSPEHHEPTPEHKNHARRNA